MTRSMSEAVEADLAAFGPEVTNKKVTWVESARLLARNIDSYAINAHSAAELSAITRAIAALHSVMSALIGEVRTDDDDDGGRLSTPSWDSGSEAAVRDAAQP